MPAYSHLLDEERDQIAVMRAAGRSICAIAGALQRAKSTVSRELRRNALPSGRYSPLHAAGAYQLRRRREGDLIICKRTRPVLVLHERKSRVTLAARLAGKTAAETISVMLAIFARIKPALRKSITFDNDTAFARHGLLQSMRAMATWFCDA